MFELETCPAFYYYVTFSNTFNSLRFCFLHCRDNMYVNEHKMHHIILYTTKKEKLLAIKRYDAFCGLELFYAY